METTIQLLEYTIPPCCASQNRHMVISREPRVVQSGRSSLAKHGDAYFSVVYGFMEDPIAAPGLYENQEP